MGKIGKNNTSRHLEYLIREVEKVFLNVKNEQSVIFTNNLESTNFGV